MACVAFLVGTTYFFWPRHANLRHFDPDSMAQLEAQMWRDYYDHHYFSLGVGLYQLGRGEYGFSPWHSVLLAWHAGRAAKVFHHTRGRSEVQKVIPMLESYYRVLRIHGREKFDVAKAARLELEWWQLRREHVLPEQYSRVIAELAAEIYREDAAALLQASKYRAGMMHFRDQHHGRMQAADWEQVKAGLRSAYRAFHEVVDRASHNLEAAATD